MVSLQTPSIVSGPAPCDYCWELGYRCMTCGCVLSHSSRVLLFVTLWSVAHQAPLFMEFSRQEYWSGLPCPPPGNFPNPGMEPSSLTSPSLEGGFFTTSATWEALRMTYAWPVTKVTTGGSDHYMPYLVAPGVKGTYFSSH